MLEAQRITDLAEAIADGRTPDWQSEELSSADPAVRGLISNLKAVHSIHGLYTTRRDSRNEDAGRTPLGPGDTWGGLEIREHVGRGRFGDVYRAWDPALDREVALKLVRHRGCDDRAEFRVVDEGRLMARLRHPNVVTIHGAQRIDGVSGLWMEFVEGRTLACELAARGPFSAEELTRTGIELSRALAAVHRAGLVHRDVKAQNVLRDGTGRIVLGDFGTGRELDEPEEMRSGLAGTPAYLAPEIFDRRPATAQSDIYSLGALLFHLATRRFPVEGRSLREIGDAHTRGDRLSLASLRGDLPSALAAVVDTALDREASQRFTTADAMACALEGCLPRMPAPPQRRRVSWLAAAILASAIGACVGWLAFRTPTVSAVPFAARDFVLVTAFENRTGEPLLDGTLEHALERALSDSPFVNVAPRGRVEDVLRLMRMAPDTLVTASVGREVATRDGRIRLVIAGRVEKVGGRYALRVAILRPQDGAIIGNVQEPSVRQEHLLQAVHRLSIDVRQRVGETLPTVDAGTATLPNVTTQSLRALQMYSRTVGMETDEGLFENLPAAEQLLRDAIHEDPGFVAAHMKLSIVLRGQNQLQASLQAIERAVQLSGSATEYERLVATGELHGVRAELTADYNERRALFERAAASYEAALHLKPDDHQALVCLTNIYGIHLDRPNLDIATRLADLRPHSAVWQDRVVMDSLRAGNVDLARRYASRPMSVDGHCRERFHGRLFEALLRARGVVAKSTARGNGQCRGCRQRVAPAFSSARLGDRLSAIVSLHHTWRAGAGGGGRGTDHGGHAPKIRDDIGGERATEPWRAPQDPRARLRRHS